MHTVLTCLCGWENTDLLCRDEPLNHQGPFITNTRKGLHLTVTQGSDSLLAEGHILFGLYFGKERDSLFSSISYLGSSFLETQGSWDSHPWTTHTLKEQVRNKNAVDPLFSQENPRGAEGIRRGPGEEASMKINKGTPHGHGLRRPAGELSHPPLLINLRPHQKRWTLYCFSYFIPQQEEESFPPSTSLQWLSQ